MSKTNPTAILILGPLFLLGLCEAPRAEAGAVHGFIEVPFKTSYITPRGLVVEDQGLVLQPIAALVLPIGEAGALYHVTLTTGIWNSIDTNQHDRSAGPWNEVDYFANLSAVVADDFEVGATYVPFISPSGAFQTEHNLEFKLAYKDEYRFTEFALRPYVKLFWALSGDSTVVLGKRGSTFDVELGIVPSYSFERIAGWRVDLTADFRDRGTGGILGSFRSRFPELRRVHDRHWLQGSSRFRCDRLGILVRHGRRELFPHPERHTLESGQLGERQS